MRIKAYFLGAFHILKHVWPFQVGVAARSYQLLILCNKHRYDQKDKTPCLPDMVWGPAKKLYIFSNISTIFSYFQYYSITWTSFSMIWGTLTTFSTGTYVFMETNIVNKISNSKNMSESLLQLKITTHFHNFLHWNRLRNLQNGKMTSLSLLYLKIVWSFDTHFDNFLHLEKENREKIS